MQTKKPRKWVCVTVGILIGAIVPPLVLGAFHLETNQIAPLAPSLMGGLGGWLWWKGRS